MEEGVVDSIRRADLASDVLLISFDRRSVGELKRLAPEMSVGELHLTRPAALPAVAAETGADWLGPSSRWIEEKDIVAAHDVGLGVYAWTAYDADEVRMRASLHVDAVATSDPQHAREALGGQVRTRSADGAV